MQHSIPDENLELAIVQSDGDVESNFLARILQITVQALLQPEFLRRHFKTRFRVLIDVHLLRGRGLRHTRVSFTLAQGLWRFAGPSVYEPARAAASDSDSSDRRIAGSWGTAKDLT